MDDVLKMQQASNLDDATKFCTELKPLMEKYVTYVGHNSFGITRFFFKDGGWIGSLRMLKDMGVINKYPDEK